MALTPPPPPNPNLPPGAKLPVPPPAPGAVQRPVMPGGAAVPNKTVNISAPVPSFVPPNPVAKQLKKETMRISLPPKPAGPQAGSAIPGIVPPGAPGAGRPAALNVTRPLGAAPKPFNPPPAIPKAPGMPTPTATVPVSNVPPKPAIPAAPAAPVAGAGMPKAPIPGASVVPAAPTSTTVLPKAPGVVPPAPPAQVGGLPKPPTPVAPVGVPPKPSIPGVPAGVPPKPAIPGVPAAPAAPAAGLPKAPVVPGTAPKPVEAKSKTSVLTPPPAKAAGVPPVVGGAKPEIKPAPTPQPKPAPTPAPVKAPAPAQEAGGGTGLAVAVAVIAVISLAINLLGWLDII